jgi:hypothetical protein
MTGAQFEIRIDGTPRSYRDRKDYAMEAARLIKSKNPHSMVEVEDLRSWDVTAVALRPGWAMPLKKDLPRDIAWPWMSRSGKLGRKVAI